MDRTMGTNGLIKKNDYGKIIYLLWIGLHTFFNSLLFRDASTSLVITRLGSLGVYHKAVYFYCCVVKVSIVKFTDFNFMIYEFDE